MLKFDNLSWPKDKMPIKIKIRKKALKKAKKLLQKLLDKADAPNNSSFDQFDDVYYKALAVMDEEDNMSSLNGIEGIASIKKYFNKVVCNERISIV